MESLSKSELARRLDEFPRRKELAGLLGAEARYHFVEQLHSSHQRLFALCTRGSLGVPDLAAADFDPRGLIMEHFGNGRKDEAFWLAFLDIHFGQEHKTVRDFYGKFGKGIWTWDAVIANPSAVRSWMHANQALLGGLKFGNHRKYRTNNPDHERGTPAVIDSFAQWVIEHGTGSPYDAFRSIASGSPDKERFDRLYRSLDKVVDFGRTARFDLCCLIGDLGLLPMTPTHCYLSDATGPKRGALRLVTGKDDRKLTREIESVIEELNIQLEVPVQVMEDALCNWQKGDSGVAVPCAPASEPLSPRQCPS